MIMYVRNEKVKEFFDSPVYLEKNLNTNIIIRSVLVRELLGEFSQQKLLDLGCGDGSISLPYAFNNNHLTLVDLSSCMLDRARDKISSEIKKQVVCHQSDLRTYQSKEQYDVVLCIGVLAHVSSVNEAIEKISQLLKNNGRCIIQITDYEKIFGKIAYWCERIISFRRYQYKLNKMTTADIKSMALEYGLQIADQRRYSLYVPGTGRLSRRYFLRYQLFTAHNKILSKYGSEVLFLFSKSDIA